MLQVGGRGSLAAMVSPLYAVDTSEIQPATPKEALESLYALNVCGVLGDKLALWVWLNPANDAGAGNHVEEIGWPDVTFGVKTFVAASVF